MHDLLVECLKDSNSPVARIMSSSPRSRDNRKIGDGRSKNAANGSKRPKEKDGVNKDATSKEKRKQKKGDDGSVVIRSPGAKKATESAQPGKRVPVEKEQKGILKNKKGAKKGNQVQPKQEVKKPRKRQRTPMQKFALTFGIYLGNVKLHDPFAVEAAQALDLQQWHLRRLRKRFDRIDLDGSGNIDYDEFFESVGEVRSPFTDKLFALIDLDGSGTIEFDEYVRVMATYCMFTKDEVLRFCFECFDVDRSGTIDEKEFVELCKSVNNASPSFPSNFKKALEEFDVNEDGLIDYGEFQAIDQRYPLVLFPAFRLQDVMQRVSLGERAWVKISEKYQKVKEIEEYKAAHGGRLPPEPALKAIAKAVLPCLFREKVHIKVGFEMEDKHRSEKM